MGPTRRWLTNLTAIDRDQGRQRKYQLNPWWYKNPRNTNRKVVIASHRPVYALRTHLSAASPVLLGTFTFPAHLLLGNMVLKVAMAGATSKALGVHIARALAARSADFDLTLLVRESTLVCV